MCAVSLLYSRWMIELQLLSFLHWWRGIWSFARCCYGTLRVCCVGCFSRVLCVRLIFARSKEKGESMHYLAYCIDVASVLAFLLQQSSAVSCAHVGGACHFTADSFPFASVDLWAKRWHLGCDCGRPFGLFSSGID